MTTVFGIRHHGPGSAKSLLNALEGLKPDCILVEGPPDANEIIGYAAKEQLVPPIALLVYNPNDLKQAAYYPFAHFSPEWQAIRYGLRKNIPVEFMDLPRFLAFPLDKKERATQQKIIHFNQLPSGARTGGIEKIAKDPLGYIAKLAGYEDSERWWEITFERAVNDSEIFQSISDLMAELRQAVREMSYRELQREAYMRKVIRAAIKKGFNNIAVVCGAWHAPALAEWESFKATQDNQSLKGIKKIKTQSTWIPWTYQRLSRQSGYSAGVISPAWYELLFDKSDEVVIHWMSKAAQLLRAEDLEASAAHVIEAVRLAKSLASLRNLSLAGINELREAAVSALCNGEKLPLELIEQQLIVGDRMGTVPDEIPIIPLQKDLNRCIRSARLSKEKKALDKVEKVLDLRKPGNLLASQLLHRLNILAIPWGSKKPNSQHTLGSFKEEWVLNWEPDFAILIIEAGMWGNTVYEAASNLILATKKKQSTLAGLVHLVEQALYADLKEVIAELTTALSNQSALTKDIFNLMEALPALVNILRYGSSRNMDTASVKIVLNQIIPRICIGLPGNCVHIDENATAEIFKKMLLVNRAIHTLNKKKYIQYWHDTLERIMGMTINGILVGMSTRILFDKNVIDTDITSTYMHLALSKGSEALFGAQWIEGFLYGSGLLLIYKEELWKILDDWVSELEEERFMEVLPILRRTFSSFSHSEKHKMMDLAKRGKTKPYSLVKEPVLLDRERVAKVLPTLRLLLDL